MYVKRVNKSLIIILLSLLLIFPLTSFAQSPSPDINQDGVFDIQDITELINRWGPTNNGNLVDRNGDNRVNGIDFTLLSHDLPQDKPCTNNSCTAYYVSNSGNDNNPGTESLPWKTLNKVNSASLQPGDWVLLEKGSVWEEPLSISRSGTSSSPITVSSYGNGNLPLIQNNSENISITSSYNVVENIEIKSSASSFGSGECSGQPIGWRVGIRLKPGSSHNIIRNSLITQHTAGIYIESGSHHNTITKNTINDNIIMSRLTSGGDDDSGAFAILLHGDDNDISYNEISGHDACSHDYVRDGAAVEVYGGKRNDIHHNFSQNNDAFTELGNSRSSDNIFAYNVFTSNLDRSIFIVTRGSSSSWGPVSNTKLFNNTVYLVGSSSQGFVCHGGCSSSILEMKNNIIVASGKAGYADNSFNEDYNIYQGQIQFSLGSHSRVTDPLFVNPGSDLHLRQNSPAIDTGINLGFTQDFDNNIVPQGLATDIGAYEFGDAHSSPRPIPSTSPSPTPSTSPSTSPISRDSFSFATVGDHGTSTRAKNIFKSVGELNPNFFLSLGDISYGQTSESNWCQMVKDNLNIGAGFSTGNNFGENYPVFIIAGGHENGRDNSGDGVIDNFVSPGCLPDPYGVVQSPNLGTNQSQTANYGKEYYFDYPRSNPLARFIMVDPGQNFLHGGCYDFGSSDFCGNPQPISNQRLQWLSDTIDDARANGIKWIIVGNHENYISMGAKGNEIGSDFFNLVVEKKVDLLLQGHDHNYQRTKQLAFGSGCSEITTSSANTNCIANNNTSSYQKGSGMVLVMPSLGGIGSRSVNWVDSQSPYFAAAQSSDYGYSHITISENALIHEYVATTGSFQDSFTITSP